MIMSVDQIITNNKFNSQVSHRWKLNLNYLITNEFTMVCLINYKLFMASGKYFFKLFFFIINRRNILNTNVLWPSYFKKNKHFIQIIHFLYLKNKKNICNSKNKTKIDYYILKQVLLPLIYFIYLFCAEKPFRKTKDQIPCIYLIENTPSPRSLKVNSKYFWTQSC